MAKHVSESCISAKEGRLAMAEHVPESCISTKKGRPAKAELSLRGPRFDEIARVSEVYKSGPRLGASHKGAAPERGILALEMPARDGVALGLLVASILWLVPRPSQGGGGTCELSVRHSDVLYDYSLASPTDKFPHGVLSEDGFYKVTVNETSLWFQICDQMIFNHDPPRCSDCQDCGGPSRCGTMCSALVANSIGGYFVCTAIGRASNLNVALIDQNSPQKGVVVKTSSIGSKVSDTFNITGNCDYAVVLRHPSGCAKVIYVNGKGWGWFGTLMMIILCLLVGYVLVGTIYRFFFLGIQGIEAIPNLDFWLSLPYRAKSMLRGLVRRFTRDSQGSYAPVNY
ncbi:hypothetical protein MUK42_06395 [Musa troglodytarum]|uniref:Autophagy-related protein 27 n=1 Tax=Musa troglodytarum TaxID=320322 RepID=A0A9E7KY17_9LILI|nr:hypothetical protein MUK42_06395 [Musa troglodytarum]